MQKPGIVNQFEGRNITHVFPAVGPNLYWEAGKKILGQGLEVPTGEYTANLLNSVYCSNKTDSALALSDQVKNILNNKWLWVFNRNIWTPKGVYVVSDKKVNALEVLNNNNSRIDLSALESRLIDGVTLDNGVIFSKDGIIRFAPKDSYSVGEEMSGKEISSDELSADGFVIANYGVEGAKLMAEVSLAFPKRPIVTPMNVDEDLQMFQEYESKVAAVACPKGERLEIIGRSIDGTIGRGTGGSAYGVLI